MASTMVFITSTKAHVPNQLTRSIDRILEEAQTSGDLNLSGRNLKEFPKVRKDYNLSETVNADFSKNRFSELPSEVIGFYCLEKLDLYHNILRSLPDAILNLQSLVYADLSRNQLQWLPPGLCQLSSLQVLLLGNNRLLRLPADLGNLTSLAELDLSANQLTQLPNSIGKLSKLRSLIVRRNQLTSIPVEVAVLRLEKLDLSANQISSLPIELRVMSCLVILELSQNPLISPPANLCARGKVHIFKYLESIAQRGDSRKSIRMSTDTLDSRSSGKRRQTLPGRVSCRTPEPEMFYNSSNHSPPVSVSSSNSTLLSSTLGSLGLINGNFSSGQSTPSTISPGAGESITLEEALQQSKLHEGARRPDKLTGLVQSTEDSNHIISPSAKSNCNSSHLNATLLSNSEQIIDDKKGPIERIQTYREYKEALKLQRWQPQDIYRKGSPHESGMTPTTPSDRQKEVQNHNVESRNNTSPEKKIDPKMDAVISYVKSQLPNGHNSPKNSNNEAMLVTATAGYVNNNSPKKCVTKNGRELPGKLSPSRTLSFTMRREHEKAKEEALLIAQLRQSLETRLKMSLPVNELAASLQDGVVLCHLANHVRPRAVASVHVPSPAVPKLTMARSRKNVENFLEACKRIGVPEESIKRLSKSFDQFFQSDSLLGGAHQLETEKHCENVIDVILQLLDLAESHNSPKSDLRNFPPPCTGTTSTFLFLFLFFSTLVITYLIPEYE